MPDYAACRGDGCQQKNQCARFRMVWSEYQCCYTEVPLEEDGTCKSFWDIAKRVPFRLKPIEAPE